MSKKNNAAATVGFIFITMLLAKLLGQVREIVIASAYGTAWQADAYVAASQIPTNFFDMILGSAVSSAFIPVFNKYLQQEGEVRAKHFAGVFFNVILLITVILSFFGVIFAPAIISVFTPGLTGETAILAVKLLRIMFPMIIFIGLAFTFVGVLQSMGEYNLPAVMSMVSSGFCIIYLFTLNFKFGITGLAVSLLLGWGLQFLILTPSTIKKGFRLVPAIKDSGILSVSKLALPVLIGTWVQPINVLVNSMIASNFPGGVSAINYANKLYIIAAGVFAMSITNYIFPKLSKLSSSQEGEKGWNEVFVSSLKTVLMVVTPIAIIFLAQSKEIVSVIYQRGEFGEDSVALTGGALCFYSIGILPFAIQEIMYKAFYSKHNSATPMVISFVGIIINIPLSIGLSKILGINGLALSTAISVITTMIISAIVLLKKSNKITALLIAFLKTIISGFVCFSVILLVKNIIINNFVISSLFSKFMLVFLCSFAGILAYLIFLGLLNLKNIKKSKKEEK
ncbi:MAG: murein biosynthesis integral membrane protein MurJ [Clostridia bacterium]|nr:murein biosynthesis integral membrane protein MurJ [Clostridia bacterium]